MIDIRITITILKIVLAERFLVIKFDQRFDAKKTM